MGRRGYQSVAGAALWEAAVASAVVRRVVASPQQAAEAAGTNPASARVQYRRWLEEGRLAHDGTAGVYYLPDEGDGAGVDDEAPAE